MNDYFSHETTYTYTDTGQVSTITAPGSKVWTYAYNALGQPTSVAIPNGMTTEYGYDTRNRLTKIEHKDGASVLDGFTYALDGGGNITRTTQADSSLWSYEYDGRGRLTKAERYDTDGTTLLHRYSYTYDDGDNLLTKLVYDGTNTVTTAFAYTNANEQTSMAAGGTTVTMAYDAWGRMTSKTDGTYSASYAYRYGDKLGSVTSGFPGEGTVTYEYGGDQKRRERSVSGGDYAWYNWNAGWTVINEENSNGTLARTYVGRNRAHVAGTSPSTGDWKYYTHDNLGSSRSIWNENKTAYATFEYTPYGALYASSGTVSEITRRYTGHDWDTTSQVYFAPFRYYSPTTARWMSRDPLGMADGPNVYAYPRTPITHGDRLGLLTNRQFMCNMWRELYERKTGEYCKAKECNRDCLKTGWWPHYKCRVPGNEYFPPDPAPKPVEVEEPDFDPPDIAFQPAPQHVVLAALVAVFAFLAWLVSMMANAWPVVFVL